MRFKLFEVEVCTTGAKTDSFPLSEFENQRKRFAAMTTEGVGSISYGTGDMYILCIGTDEEFDELGVPAFDEDGRVLCYQGDCGPRLHQQAKANVEKWKDVLEGTQRPESMGPKQMQ